MPSPSRPDPDPVSDDDVRWDAIRSVLLRGILFGIGFALIGVVMTVLGIPWPISLVTMLIAWIWVVFELDL